jgi:hypothetical protein
MSNYRMRDNEFQDSSGRTIAKIVGKELQDTSGRTLLKINGDEIQESSGRTLAKIRGDEIQDSSGRKIASISDISKGIDGAMGGASIAAFWLRFMR